MSRIWSMMDVGKRSMMNSQTALQTVSHNVANKSTEGYSRQRVDFVSNEPVGLGALRIGTGARPGIVGRVNNGFLEKQIERETNHLGTMGARADLMGRVEQVYNEQVNKGLNQFMAQFFNAFRELSNNPESLASRTIVKENADFLGKDFGRVNNQLKEIQKDADFRITSLVTDINGITREIASLNEKVSSVEMQGGPANDERDRRDLLVKKLGEKVNIRYGESKDGQLTITAGNNAILVSGFSHRDLEVASTPAHGNKREDNLDIFYKSTDSGNPVVCTRQFTGGEMGGLLDVRDNVVNHLLGNMDQLAYSLAKEVNAAHVQGYDRQGRTGNLFFENIQNVEGASTKLKVDEPLLEDVGRIAAALGPNAPGDNRIANVLSSLQYKQAMENGATFDEFYGSTVGQVGIEAQRANTARDTQTDIVKQLKNVRESISGVSLDEETTKMIEFQKSFDASARLVRAADEMMDTVLNLKRL
jgi:flagellar hook-associated protein 1 FlgK